MTPTTLVLFAVSAGVVAVAYLRFIRILVRRRRDLGMVSERWLVGHKAPR